MECGVKRSVLFLPKIIYLVSFCSTLHPKRSSFTSCGNVRHDDLTLCLITPSRRTRHISFVSSSALLCCRLLIFLQLQYLKPGVYISFSRSLFQVFLHADRCFPARSCNAMSIVVLAWQCCHHFLLNLCPSRFHFIRCSCSTTGSWSGFFHGALLAILFGQYIGTNSILRRRLWIKHAASLTSSCNCAGLFCNVHKVRLPSH